MPVTARRICDGCHRNCGEKLGSLPARGDSLQIIKLNIWLLMIQLVGFNHYESHDIQVKRAVIKFKYKAQINMQVMCEAQARVRPMISF